MIAIILLYLFVGLVLGYLNARIGLALGFHPNSAYAADWWVFTIVAWPFVVVGALVGAVLALLALLGGVAAMLFETLLP